MSGFELINQQLWITKDPEAQLFYTLDWSQWLPTGDTVDTVDYSISARINDPEPLLKISQGKTADDTKTYIELSAGQVGKSYTVTCAIQTANGLKDRRNFKVKVENRSA